MTKRHEFAAHWPVVAAAFFGIMTGAWAFPLQILGPLIKPLEAEFGWSRTGIVACSSFLAAGLVIGTPIAGRLADKISVRLVAMVSMVILSLCLTAIAFIGGSIWHLQAIYFCIGLLGAGCGGVTFTRAIGGWFVEGRGLALGIALTGTGVASFVAPNLMEFVGGLAGWRAACIAVAALTLVIGLPIVFLGLAEPPKTAPIQPGAAAVAGEFTRGEALRDIRFWILAMTVLMLGLFVGSLLVHAVPMLIDMGLSPERAAAVASINGIAMIVGRLVTGPLLDRFPAAYVGAGIFLLGASGAALFVMVGPSAAIFMIAAIGLLIGAEVDLMSYMALHYFGVRSYGAIFGILMAIYSAGGIVTSVVSGALIASGGYGALFTGASCAFAIATLLFLTLIIPRVSGLKKEPMS